MHATLHTLCSANTNLALTFAWDTTGMRAVDAAKQTLKLLVGADRLDKDVMGPLLKELGADKGYNGEVFRQ